MARILSRLKRHRTPTLIAGSEPPIAILKTVRSLTPRMHATCFALISKGRFKASSLVVIAFGGILITPVRLSVCCWRRVAEGRLPRVETERPFDFFLVMTSHVGVLGLPPVINEGEPRFEGNNDKQGWEFGLSAHQKSARARVGRFRERYEIVGERSIDDSPVRLPPASSHDAFPISPLRVGRTSPLRSRPSHMPQVSRQRPRKPQPSRHVRGA